MYLVNSETADSVKKEGKKTCNTIWMKHLKISVGFNKGSENFCWIQ